MKKHLLWLPLVIAAHLFAQKPVVKYGVVKPDDFAPKQYPIDSSADAVVLYDYCKAKYEGGDKADFNVVYKFHKRIRLLSKNAFNLATISIPLFMGEKLEEKIENLEATTFNLENGVVVSSKIDKKSLFKDKATKTTTFQKFTLPNIKEGCIIDYTYTVSSPFPYFINPWYFQGSEPVLWSEYDLTIPSIYNFIKLRQGYHPFAIDTVATSSDSYLIYVAGETSYDKGETITVLTDTYHNTWAMQNLPALKTENYTTTLKNHVAKLEFQLAGLRYPNRPEIPRMRTWYQLVEELMKDESFGIDLNARNGWLTDDVNRITTNATTPIAKAKKIYAYLRDNYTCTNHDALSLTAPIKKIYQNKSGNVADINLLLTAMLKNLGMDAAPVLLSTRSHGLPYDAYPIINKFNYVICRLMLDSTAYYLDASQSKLGFAKLPEACYNGNGRLIADVPILINLSPSELSESKLTTVNIINQAKDSLSGSFASSLGYNESTDLREKLVNTTKEDFFKNIKKSFSAETEIHNTDIENLKDYDEATTIKYDFAMPAADDIIYFNPMLNEGYKTNPFKTSKRLYPVEMPYAINETYVLSMEIPPGYVVEETPKSVRVKYNENQGKFEYILVKTANTLQLRSSIVMNNATFPPDEYESLRDFFAYIVKKQSELIVLKKNK